jgi:hypothetical protein
MLNRSVSGLLDRSHSALSRLEKLDELRARRPDRIGRRGGSCTGHDGCRPRIGTGIREDLRKPLRRLIRALVWDFRTRGRDGILEPPDP